MDVGRVKIGQHVEASVVAYPNQTFPGTVKWTSDVLDPATRTERVRVELANQDRKLRPEMYATLTVTVDERSTVSLPRTALVRLGDLMFVFVAKGQTADGRTRFERRRVTLPVEVPAEGLVPILSGVQVGDNVVVRGAILLSES